MKQAKNSSKGTLLISLAGNRKRIYCEAAALRKRNQMMMVECWSYSG